MKRVVQACLLVSLSVALCGAVSAQETPVRIVKVLPHYLDLRGRHMLAPSLYERDAYQAYLRQHPEKRSGLRFDVQWKSRELEEVTLRVELRGSAGSQPTRALMEKKVRRGFKFSTWSKVALEGEAYKQFGELLAWRVTLWHDQTLLAEQKSFLW